MLKNLSFSIPRADAADATFQMIAVEGTGDTSFTMGAASESDGTLHPVHLSSFYIGKYPVTQALWSAVVNARPDYVNKLPTSIVARPSYFVGDALPVEQVSWHNAQHFIKVLNDLTATTRRTAGVGVFALPTEAQWEYAARGGVHHSDNYRYAGCNYADLDKYAWYEDNNNRTTMPVGTRLPNQLGIYDMSGNVWEWCRDWYDSDFYKSPAAQELDPCNNKVGRDCIFRGGGGYRATFLGSVRFRNRNSPIFNTNTFGLRLVLLSL